MTGLVSVYDPLLECLLPEASGPVWSPSSLSAPAGDQEVIVETLTSES